MGRKRPRSRYHHHRSRSPPSNAHLPKQTSLSSNPNPPTQEQQPGNTRQQGFVSYKDAPKSNLPPKIKLLCDIIASTPSQSVEQVLDDSVSGLRITQEEAEEVLKLSYGYPASAVKFFRWSDRALNGNHSPYAWNLVVDMLGKNLLFDAMWDAIKSMQRERLLSLATFASVFSSYVLASRVEEAIVTFNVIDKYGVARDIVALNSLLSAICRDGRVADALEFLSVAKLTIRPDSDTYAILLEGCEKEGNESSGKIVFAEMVAEIGWNPSNVPAYTSFVCTLLKGRDGIHEAMTGIEMMRARRCYPGIKFLKDALEECMRRRDDKSAEFFWEDMVKRHGLEPDTELYNSMIDVHCSVGNVEMGMRLLEEMVYNGSFPDHKTYNVLFQCLIKNKKLGDASCLFTEMVKNEAMPSLENCKASMKVYVGEGDSVSALKVWKWMVENHESELEETANLLVVGLRDMKMLPEAVKYAEDIIERKIKLNSSTLSKLKQSLVKEKKGQVYDEILRKWKLESSRR